MSNYSCSMHDKPVPADYFIYEQRDDSSLDRRGYAACSEHILLAIEHVLGDYNDVAVIIKKVSEQ